MEMGLGVLEGKPRHCASDTVILHQMTDIHKNT